MQNSSYWSFTPSRFFLIWSVVAERSSALDSSSGVVRMWVRVPAWPIAVLVSLSKTLNHNCFVLRMGRKAVGPVCCVMHVKEHRTLIVFLDLRLEHPAGWICVLQIFCIIIIIIIIKGKMGQNTDNIEHKSDQKLVRCEMNSEEKYIKSICWSTGQKRDYA